MANLEEMMNEYHESWLPNPKIIHSFVVSKDNQKYSMYCYDKKKNLIYFESIDKRWAEGYIQMMVNYIGIVPDGIETMFDLETER